MKINGSKKYLTCFPAKETYNPIEMDSVTHFYKEKADYVIYMELFDGQMPPTKLNTVTVVTQQQVDNLPDHIRAHILRCINYKEVTHQQEQGKQKGKQKGKQGKQQHQHGQQQKGQKQKGKQHKGQQHKGQQHKGQQHKGQQGQKKQYQEQDGKKHKEKNKKMNHQQGQDDDL